MTVQTSATVPEPSTRRRRRGRNPMPYVADSILLEEAAMPWLVRSSVIAAGIIVALFIVWSAVTRSPQISVASGAIKPSGNVQAVQHLEGGIVTEILVHEGDIVERGQTLIKLEPASVGSDLALVKGRREGLQLRAERLRAFIDGREPDFDAVGPEFASLVADQRQILAGQIAAREASREVLRNQLSEQQSHLAGLDKRAVTARRHIDLLQKELDARNGLAEKGLTSRFQLLHSEQDVNQAEGALAQINAEKDQLARAIEETRSRMAEVDATARADALAELDQVNDELRATQESIEKYDDRFRRLDLRAPVRGVVQTMHVHTVGGVIGAGETVVEIVPVNNELVAEIRLSPRDIGQITTGQAARIKLTTYDFARYGAVDGVLERVSPTTVLDSDGQPYYRGVVRLNKSYIGNDPNHHPITPGMTLTAEIVTQDRSLLEYLLKPVIRGLDEGFHER